MNYFKFMNIWGHKVLMLIFYSILILRKLRHDILIFYSEVKNLYKKTYTLKQPWTNFIKILKISNMLQSFHKDYFKREEGEQNGKKVNFPK